MCLLRLPFRVKLIQHCWQVNRLLSSVNSHVGLKVSISVERHATLLAGVRLLSSVNSHVGINVSFSVETFSTLRAGVRLFSSVNSQMGFKVCMMIKTLSTLRVRTFVKLLSSVSSNVPVKGSF